MLSANSVPGVRRHEVPGRRPWPRMTIQRYSVTWNDPAADDLPARTVARSPGLSSLMIYRSAGMDLDALMLSRIQFGFTISFHIIFPAITIGLASYLAVLEACWLRTSNVVYRDLYHFWVKVFAVNFGMGVVSGAVMAYQFGTNWSRFSDFAGGITGPLLAYEVLTAFFLEAGFLGVMLFGWKRVGPGLHFFSTVMVALGTLISATWILASNSWMHTPQGYE